ncbi:hypothetical protein PENSPDRAFT_760297 [Peniophora sp. CONT]|nr:hypothetical protein PENSPDRAFT_760297 [Peniophora sp. CONT]
MSADLESIELDSLNNLTIASSPPGSLASLTRSKPPPNIDRLPVELLCRVFCWLPHFDDEDSGVTLNTRTPTWVPVLHVCSLWRVIAMECKELWSCLPLGHPEWTKIALRLSDPLAIAIRIPGEEIFAHFDDDTPIEHRLMKDAFALVVNHLPRVWHLDVKMSRPESSDEDDGEAHTDYLRAREMLAPLRNTHMERLTSFHCARVDLRAGSFFDESWTSHVRHLTLTGCTMPKHLRLFHLPLVSLSINLPYYHDGFAEWLVFLASLPESLERLTVWDALKPSHLDEVLDDRAPSWDRCIKLPRLKELVLMRSPFLTGYYLRYFDIPHTAQLLLLWWAADYDVPGAIFPEYAATASWPMIDDWGELTETLDPGIRIYWLSAHMCKAVLTYAYGVVTGTQHDAFDPIAYTLGRVYEKDEQYTLTMHGIGWAPSSSTLVAVWAEGPQAMYQDVFGVTSISDYAEWPSILDVMRAHGAQKGHAHTYLVPAVFSCVFEESSFERMKEAKLPTLTLVALHRTDFTSPILETYFLGLLYLLYRSEFERDPVFNITIIFPFGLKLSKDQRERIMRYNLRVSELIEDYQYPEFQDVDPNV